MRIDFAQIEKHLNELPSQIRDAQKEVITAKGEVERVKLELSIAKSASITASKAPNATEKTAFAIMATKAEQLKLIEAEEKKEEKENIAEYLNNRFIAVRKIASLEQEILKSQLGGT